MKKHISTAYDSLIHMGAQDQHYPHFHVFLLRCVIALTSIRVPSNKDIILSGTTIPTDQEFMHYFIKLYNGFVHTRAKKPNYFIMEDI